jgi:hypothetical protein
LPGGLTQTFQALTAAGRADIQSTQSDGSTFTLTVPLAFPDFILPDFSQETIGTYADPDRTMSFSLISTPRYASRWAALVSDTGDGLAGTFSLNGDFSGAGQLEEINVSGQTLAALMSWTQEGEVQVYLLTGQNLYMGPAGAALDFLQHRWQTLAALLAPAPGVGMAVHRPRWFRNLHRRRAGQLHLPGTIGRALRQPIRTGAYPPPRQPALSTGYPVPRTEIRR